ncbi:MAG TPA: HAD-IIIA family hydrolase [Bryobacteraceae bacterium]|nr:HAD-IIIA family hydrolase [Bryobacteraceae bacterium]
MSLRKEGRSRAGRFAILDRDGTVIVEKNYLADPAGVELIQNAAEGLRRLEELGWGRLIVTNQSGVNRGYFTRRTVDAIHERMLDLLAREGAAIDGIYVCPHTPEERCDCRKPESGLVLQAAADWGFDPARCVFIGDKACDVDLGRRLGGTTILVRTGYGEEELRKNSTRADFVVSDLKEAAEVVMKLNDEGEGARILRSHIAESIATRQRMASECEAAVLAAAGEIVTSLTAGGKLLLCGNGGSAADAQHIAGELVSVLSKDFPRQALAAAALTTNSSILTAIANDFGYGSVFERQVEALGRAGDVVLGITTSGNSENVVRALRAAREGGMRTIAMTGSSAGQAGELADVTIRVPSDNVQHIQEAHISIGHILCAIVERRIVRTPAAPMVRPTD